MRRSELPTEPELRVTPREREAALRLWCEHHCVPSPLEGLLRGIVQGHQGRRLAEQAGVQPADIPELELAFERLMGQSVYQAAADILNAAVH